MKIGGRMKKLLSVLAAALILLCAFTFVGSADYSNETQVTKNLYSDVYYMTSLDDGSVMFKKNESKKVQPAAFVKILAAVAATEKWGNLEETVKITEKSLSLVEYDYGVRVASLKKGETYTKKQLVDCLIIYGANDAASVIAYDISKSEQAFVAEMQALAEKIGCKNTVVKNITGFDADGQYTTAEDVATLIKYALNYPSFSEAFSAKEITLPKTSENEERTFSASNRMTNATIPDYYHASVTGGKQTSTDKAGECIAVVSSQDGYSYLTVVMGGKLKDVDKDTVDENTCMTDARRLLSWVYENIRFRVVATANQTVTTVPVIAGRSTDTLRLVPAKETSALVPAGGTSDSVLIEPIADTLPKSVTAPIKAGDVICKARVCYAGQEIITIDLVAANDVSLSVFRLIMTGVRRVTTSKPFIAAEFIAFAAVVAHIVLQFKKQNQKKEQKKRSKPNNGEKKAKS